MKIVRYRLEEYLNSRGISRYELAKRTGIQYQVIDGYYKNKVFRIDTYNLGKILEALDCGLEDVLAVEDREKPV